MTTPRALTDHERAVWDACIRCHDQCVSACPVFGITGETRYYPSRLALAARSWVDGESGMDFKEATNLFYGGCIACGLCEDHCVYQDEPKSGWAIVHGARTRLADSGPVLDAWQQRREELLGAESSDLAYRALVDSVACDVEVICDFVATSRPRKATHRGDTLLLVDPYSAAWTAQGVKALVKILVRGGWRILVPDRPVEAGGLLWQEGLVNEGRAAAESVARAIFNSHVSRVVMTLPNDVWHWNLLRGGEQGDGESGRESGLPQIISAVEALAATVGGQAPGRSGVLPDALAPTRPKRRRPNLMLQPSSVIERYLKQGDILRATIAPWGELAKETGPMGGRASVWPVAVEGVGLWVADSLARGLRAARLGEIAALAPDVVLSCDPFSHRALGLELRDLENANYSLKTVYEFVAVEIDIMSGESS